MRWTWLSPGLLVGLLAGCGDDASPGPGDAGGAPEASMDSGGVDLGRAEDGGPDVAPPAGCAGDAECDDSDPCTTDACRAGACRHDLRDGDADGHPDAECGGDDCDDADPLRYPGRMEVCDADDRDEDCDAVTFGFRDLDGDGSPDARCCNGEGATRTCGRDCDDANPTVGPTSPELCDGLDNDCDGEMDEGVLRTFTVDADGDGHGSDDPGAERREGCFAPAGFAERADDCDDRPGDGDDVHPGAPDLCDPAMRDEDCDGTPNNPPGGCACTGAETRDCPLPGVCAVGVQQCSGGMWSPTCSVEPSDETCNGADDDCDGFTDEGTTIRCYRDSDNDTYPAAGAMPTDACPAAGRVEWGGCPVGSTNREPAAGATDCADDDALRNPGATERCNGADDDCDTTADDGFSCVLGSSMACTTGGGAPGAQSCRPDCSGYSVCASGGEGPAFPGTCNGIDDNGDGVADEGFTCVQNVGTRACTVTACATMGQQVCNATCDGYGSCRAAERCNYCDDDGNGVTSAEERLLLPAATPPLDVQMLCSNTDRYGSTTSCSPLNPIVAGPELDEVGAVYLRDPVQVGYGTVTMTVAVGVLGSTVGDPDSPQQGWTLVFFLDGLGSGFLGTRASYGLPYGRTGYGVRWQFAGAGTDLAVVRDLASAGLSNLASWNPTPRHDDRTVKTQRLVATVTPDDPDTPADETRICFRHVGAATDPFCCGGAGVPCPHPIATGDRLRVGVTGATGTTNAAQIIFQQGSGSHVELADVCPAP